MEVQKKTAKMLKSAKVKNDDFLAEDSGSLSDKSIKPERMKTLLGITNCKKLIEE